MKLILLTNYYQLVDKLQFLRKSFANYLSADIKLSKTQII